MLVALLRRPLPEFPVILTYPFLDDPPNHAFRDAVLDADRQGTQLDAVLECQFLLRDGTAERTGLLLVFGFDGLPAAGDVVVLEVFHGNVFWLRFP